jgi:hypothetical protein
VKRVLGFLALGGVAPALADAGGGLVGAMSTVSWMGRGVWMAAVAYWRAAEGG